MNSSLRFPRYLGFAAVLFRAAVCFAHPDPAELAAFDSAPAFFLAQADARPAQTPGSPAAANRVSISIDGDLRVIRSNGWPDHPPGAFPRRGNPNTATPQDYTFKVPLHPAAAATPQRHEGWFFAVAVNGVPFEPGTAETWNNDRSSGWRYEANTGFLDLGLDEHNAHVQPNGAYHYHALPIGLVDRLGGDGRKMLLIAWAADGFPVYTSFGLSDPNDLQSPLRKMKSSFHLKPGARPASAGGPGGNYDGRFTEDWEYAAASGDLDECNGRFGVTPEFPGGTYHYYVTDAFPFLPRQWRGTPDASFGKSGGLPPRSFSRQAGGPGAPQPPGGRGGFERRIPVPPLMMALDPNGDGTIDAAEIAAAPENLRKLDRNGDGKLTLDELRPPGLPSGSRPSNDQLLDLRRGPPPQ